MNDAGPGNRSASWLRRHSVALGITAAALVVAFFGSSLYTDRPQFCTTCHEMQPFYDAWAAGPHAETSCIHCHVGPGVERFTHKFVALREVYDHFATHPAFPMLGVEVPDSRCLRCHDEIATQTAEAFSHTAHLDQGVACSTCHGATGHVVTPAALEAQGVYNAGNMPPGAAHIGDIPSGGGKPSVLIGHKKVECVKCHDMANASCQLCHTPPGSHFGAECKACHKPNIAFADTKFSHPRIEGEHDYRSFACANCHPNGFTTWSCTKCHKGGAPRDD